MTSTDLSTPTDWTAQYQATLDKACADYQRFRQEHPDEELDVPVDMIDCIIDYDVSVHLLVALADLSERLWQERIAGIASDWRRQAVSHGLEVS